MVWYGVVVACGLQTGQCVEHPEVDGLDEV